MSGAAWKAPSLLSLSSCLAQFLLAAGDRGPVFAYVPELYIETMVSRSDGTSGISGHLVTLSLYQGLRS